MEASDGCKLIKILLSILDTKPSHAEKIVQHEGFFQVTLDTLGQFIFDLKAVCNFVYLCAQSQLSEKRLTFMVEYTKQFFSDMQSYHIFHIAQNIPERFSI